MPDNTPCPYTLVNTYLHLFLLTEANPRLSRRVTSWLVLGSDGDGYQHAAIGKWYGAEEAEEWDSNRSSMSRGCDCVQPKHGSR